MHISNYISWLRGRSTSKGFDCVSLKLKAAPICGDPKLLADAMKSYPRVKDRNTRDCALEGYELFKPTKQKFNLPPGVDCDSHLPNKVKYSMLRPNTRVKRASIEESLNPIEHDVAHTTSV